MNITLMALRSICTGFYSGIERLFELIATVVDGTLPKGASWHQELLKQMQNPIPDIRPPVISEESRTRLDGYRDFRHVVRNVYTYTLDSESIRKLVDALPDTFERLCRELNAFADFVEQGARDTEE